MPAYASWKLPAQYVAATGTTLHTATTVFCRLYPAVSQVLWWATGTIEGDHYYTPIFSETSSSRSSIPSHKLTFEIE